MTALSFVRGFGERSADWTHLGGGWRAPQNGFRMSVGGASEFWLENPGAHTDWVLELDLEAGNPPHRVQRLTVLVRGEAVGRCVIAARRRAAFAVPAQLLAAPGPVRLQFHHVPGETPNDWVQPDPAAPALIFRRLEMLPTAMGRRAAEPLGGLPVEKLVGAAGMPADAFMRHFESLGENCEFGFVQRRCGAEPLGLFRFGAPKLPELIACLRERLAHIGNEENLRIKCDPRGNPPEYMIQDVRSIINFHSFRFDGQVDEARLIRQQGQRLRRLAQKFLEDAENGQKIMVWRASNTWTDEAEAIALHDALRALGALRLLWLEASDANHPPGSVEEIRPGLLRGHVHGFCALDVVHSADAERWLDVCVSAYRHFCAEQPAPRAVAAEPDSPTRMDAAPPATLTLCAHVAHIGDVESGEDGWTGLLDGSRAIEGFAILDDGWPKLAMLRYQVLQHDRTLSELSAIGAYCGTRGKNRPILGFRLSIPDDVRERYDFIADARFADGTTANGIAASTLCAAPKNAALTALRILVREHLD